MHDAEELTKQDPAAGAQAYLRFADHYPKHDLAPEALYDAALALDAAGDHARARKVRDRLLREHPDHPLAKHVREGH